MLSGLYAKLICLALITLMLVGLFLWGRHVGASSVQAKWDTANASQTVVAVKASEGARATENRQATDFAGIASGYLQATTDAYPSLSDALPAAVAAGTVQLRDTCPAHAGGGVSQATADSRAADAAVTQALADRVANSIAAVSAGDAADKREADFRALIVALRAALTIERTP